MHFQQLVFHSHLFTLFGLFWPLYRRLRWRRRFRLRFGRIENVIAVVVPVASQSKFQKIGIINSLI